MHTHTTLCALAFAVLLPLSSARAADTALDPRTAEQLRAMEGMVNELRRGGADATPEMRSLRGDSINQAFVVLTGEAVNPLFGVTALGMYNYFMTEPYLRDRLPLYDQPVVWIPLLAIILLMLFNSTVCEALPFLKMPLNALGDVVNKAGAVAVLPLVVKMFADTVSRSAGAEFAQAANWLFPAAYAAEGGLAAGAWPWVGWAVAAVVGAVCFAAVWLTFNVVDVLILICPFPGIDAMLKSLRIAVIGVLAGSYALSPTLALILSLALTLVSFMVAGWSFRLSVFGFIFSTDILFFRRVAVVDGKAPAFVTDGLVRRHRIPMRTFGRLERDDAGMLHFSYRPWLLLPRRRLALGDAGGFACGRGLFNPFLVEEASVEHPLLRLPPRYRGGEEELTAAFGLRGVMDCGTAVSVKKWLAAQLRGVSA